MAKNQCLVLLGYEDDPITEKQLKLVDYTTNKDWPNSDVFVPSCTICGGVRRLVLQIYAPLDASAFHRTLYLFCCLNCSSQSAGWTCIRVQMLEKHFEKETRVRPLEKIEWCTGADDWGEDNEHEENGNVVTAENFRISDEEDESNSIGSDPLPGFNQLGIDDKNANAPGACAVEPRQHSPSRPSAEIEGGEAEVIMLDSPPVPQKDIYALLTKPAHREIGNEVVMQAFYVAVEEEKSGDTASDHIQDLLMEYESRDDLKRTSPEEPGGAAGGGAVCDDEMYERGIPLHGDLMFHHFVQRIQENPGHFLRYSRDASPLLIAPLHREPSTQKCQNCAGDVICELQILPTLIPKLRLDTGDAVNFDFGNVLVFTCAKSCWDTPDKMRFEAVVVQQEELPVRNA